MSSPRRRALRARAPARRGRAPWVMLASASLSLACSLLGTRRAAAESTLPPAPVWLGTVESGVQALVYPPQDRSAPRPVTVMLHGMCDEPERECPYFAEVVTRSGWLICPRAETRCPDGGSIWGYQRRHRTVERAVELVHAAFPGELDETHGRTLIGFSLGALFGMDLGHQGAGRYPRLLLIGAKVEPYAALLRRAGVERVIFAAGDRDMMSAHMREQARRLDRQGVPTQFVSLGAVGHWFPEDLEPRLAAMLTWLDGAG
ncbi:MAG TPA: hypothetical protein PLU22_22570 [Polyangiaceae bacterium]|nr:hypothetical protein [Polyangiaceae bacterium]